MPWAKKDVESHKSGLSDEQKKEWVSIANSARQDCLDKGGSEDECDAKAIRIANSQVGQSSNTGNTVKSDQYDRLTGNIQNTGTLDTQKLDGVDHYRVPVVMLVEGVHNGSAGPVLYEEVEFSKYPQLWNGRIIPLWHPTNDAEQPVSANSPEIWEQQRLGWLFNTRIEYGQNDEGERFAKLKSDAWLNVNDLSKKAPEVKRAVENGEVVEVSTGLISDWELVNGVWNGEEYEKIARNMRPDHLAVLPGGKGACSIEDGAGLMRNQASGTQEKSWYQRVLNWLKPSLGANENGSDLSHEDLRRRLNSAVEEAHGGKNFFTLVWDVYDDYVVYIIEKEGGEETLYREGYSVDDNGEVTLAGSPEEVRIKTEVVPVQQNSNTGGNEMERKAIIDGLISNTEVFAEGDRQVLEGKEDAALQALHEKFLKEPETEPSGDKGNGGEGGTAANDGGGAPAAASAPQTFEDVVNSDTLDPKLREQLNEGQRVLNEEKERHKQTILNAEGNQFTREELDKMDVQMLRRTSALTGNTADMQGRVDGNRREETTTNRPAPLGTVNHKPKKDNKDDGGGKDE